MQRIGSPPYKDLIKDTAVERKWVETFGGSERRVNTSKEHLLSILFSPEYQLSDLLKLSKGNKESTQNLLPTLQEFNAFKEIPKLDIPAYFCVGKYDYETSFELAERYYEQLETPKKQLFWFNESAHWPHLEEPEKFLNVMLQVKQETYIH